ncbi:MAG: DUF3298 domain-containing protein [Oscillospiraceae bacterium]|nr:DUF3298 domain-containing protein [Oscillospiraceae bacterium]
MKKTFSVLLAFAMLLSLAACSGAGTQTPAPSGSGSSQSAPTPAPAPQVKTAPTPLQLLLGGHAESKWSEDFTMLCQWDWNSILLSEAAAKEFPKLNSSLRKLNTKAYEHNVQRFNEMLPLAEEDAAEWESFGGYTSRIETFIQRADDRIVSVREDAGEYTGGAHPDYGTGVLNLDPTTGQSLNLTDVLTDISPLPAILTEKLTKKYPTELYSTLQEQLDGYTEDHYTWTLDYQGITFYFNPYEIAPYSAGLLTATIWFDEMPDLFVKEYTIAPEGGWAKPLPTHSQIEVDLNRGDGNLDQLYFSSEQNENGSLELYASFNDQQSHLECYGFTLNPILVCLGEPGSERYFLYIEAYAESDYGMIYVYDLNGDELTLIDQFCGGRFHGFFDESLGTDGTWCEDVFTIPSEFVLDTTIQFLGTWTGTRTYSANPENGIVQPHTEYYFLPEDAAPIISSVDLEVTMLPSGTRETLPVGTGFRPLRTDGETYAELALKDGRECRIQITHIDYAPTINGIPEQDCFENLMYAG